MTVSVSRSTAIRVVGSSRTASISARTDSCWQLDRQQADLAAVVPEDVGEARRDHGAEPVVLQRPRRVLPARSAPEVGAGDEDRGARVALVVQDERRVLPPLVEEERSEPGALDPLQELRRHDLIGVHVGAVERDGRALDAT